MADNFTKTPTYRNLATPSWDAWPSSLVPFYQEMVEAPIFKARLLVCEQTLSSSLQIVLESTTGKHLSEYLQLTTV
jgi:hypothetical protein